MAGRDLRAAPREADVIVLDAHPPLFGAADTNGCGLKIFAYLRRVRLPFEHRHVMAPRPGRAGSGPVSATQAR